MRAPRGLSGAPMSVSFLAISAAERVVPGTSSHSRTRRVLPNTAFQRINPQTWPNTKPQKTLTSGAS